MLGKALVAWAHARSGMGTMRSGGMEFSSQKAMENYLSRHPNADRSKHSVAVAPSATTHEMPEGRSSRNAARVLDPSQYAHLPTSIGQATRDPGRIFADAKVAHEHQVDLLKQMHAVIGGAFVRGDKNQQIDFAKPGPVFQVGPMKEQHRSTEKVMTDYGGDWSKIGDAVRSTIAVDKYSDVPKMLASLNAALSKAGIEIARRPKDRFAKTTPGGYRDVMLSVRYPNGHIGEIQIHTKPMLQAKEVGHQIYDVVREIDADRKREKRGLTSQERNTVLRAFNDMQTLYDRAWKRSQ